MKKTPYETASQAVDVSVIDIVLIKASEIFMQGLLNLKSFIMILKQRKTQIGYRDTSFEIFRGLITYVPVPTL